MWVGQVVAMYAAVPALLLNFAVAAVLTVVLRAMRVAEGVDRTDATAYVG